jgi:serine/threonine protein kinase
MALPSNTTLVETLGEGTFGTVYVARLQEGAIERTVVLKVLKSAWADNEDILSRSKDEAALLARLNHDNIIKVEQLTSIQGRPAVVMEYVRGLTLDVVLKRHGAIPVGVVLQIVARVAAALDAAFNKIPPGMDSPLCVVHRDIKPSNIILSVNGAVKVLDFGTARGEFGAREAETVSVTLGSPRYMAPERFDGVNSGAAIDIYALGITFYELLGGRSMGRLPLNPDRQKAKVEKALEALRPEKGGGKDLDALLKLLKDCLAYQAEDRVSAADFRKRALKILSRLSGATVTLDVFSETVVEPIWESRKKTAVIPIGQSDDGLFSDQGSSLSMAKGGRSGLSGHSAASSLVVAAGGSRKVAMLLAGGITMALIGLLMLKNAQNSPDSQPIDPSKTEEQVVQEDQTPQPALALPGPITDSIVPTETPGENENSADEELPEEESSKAQEPEKATAVKAAPTLPKGDPISFRMASLPAGAQIQVGGATFSLPATSSDLPAGTYATSIQFPSGTEFTCTITASDGKTLLFREKNQVCP